MPADAAAGLQPGGDPIGHRAVAKISWRLLPLIVLVYFVAYIDRQNVSFAALTMNKQLGISAYMYGWGAGIFFLGYFLFEVPSNILLERVGARRWIARIMITWGLVSGAMAFIGGPTSFLVMRFLLGVAEAGFFPGVLLYFTYWFPAEYRARVVSALFLAVPGSNAAAASLSAVLLRLDGVAGLRGWQWMFVAESIPAILLAPVVLFLLTDRPSAAKWLTDDERSWLEGRLREEQGAIERRERLTLAAALTDSRVLGLSMIYLTIVTATYGVTFFLPLIVQAQGRSNDATALITTIVYVVGLIGMVLVAYSSDRLHERRWHFIISALVAALGLAVAAMNITPMLSLVAIGISTIGIYGSKPAFWPLPSQFLSGTAAAGGIALVNATGNLGGFIGPYIVGWLHDVTHSYAPGVYFLAGCALVSAAIALTTKVTKA